MTASARKKRAVRRLTRRTREERRLLASRAPTNPVAADDLEAEARRLRGLPPREVES